MSYPKLTDAKRAADPIVVEAGQIEKAIGNIAIVSNMGMETAVSSIADIKDRHKEVDDKRKSFVGPLKQVIKDIDDFFKPALDSLKTAEAELKHKVSRFVDERVAQRDKLLGEVNDVDPADRADLIDRATKLVPPKTPGLSIRENWTGEMVDSEMLLKWAVENKQYGFLMIDEKVLKAHTKSMGGDPKIPGWDAYPKSTVVITPSKVKR